MPSTGASILTVWAAVCKPMTLYMYSRMVQFPMVDLCKGNISVIPSMALGRAKAILHMKDSEDVVDLGMGGDGEARYWTCDFS
jgi:N-acetylglutamate synthase/N-acetylornithine aminotransferase